MVVEGEFKECRTCGEVKPIDKFRLRADKRAHRPHCNKCLTDRANRSEAGIRARTRYFLMRKYSMTPGGYAELLFEQQGLCAICRGAPKANGVLYVDHCHDTGKVRGLLCNTCNAGLGQFRDSQDLLARALEYLSKAGE